MHIIDTTAMSRDEWLELRKKSIGASDAPVIAGLSTYKSRLALWLEKLGHSEPTEAGEEAWWGTNLEELIEERLHLSGALGSGPYSPSCDQGRQVMIRHPNVPWMTATLDLVDGDQIWEFKAAGIRTAKQLVNEDASTLSESWVVQAHHQMMCAEKGCVRFAVFVGHRLNLFQFVVERDDALCANIDELEHEFWHHVRDETPPADFDPDDAQVLLRHFKKDNGVEIVCDSPRLLTLAKQYEQAVANARFQSDMADQIKAALLMEMREAHAMRLGPYQCTRTVVQVKASIPKPKAAFSYVKFGFVNTESED